MDDLEIPNERLAWLQVAEDLKKPVYLRTETEASRMLTLFSRLRYFQSLSFPERFALTKAATFHTASAGQVLITACGNPELGEDNEVEGDRGHGGPKASTSGAGETSSSPHAHSNAVMDASSSGQSPHTSARAGHEGSLRLLDVSGGTLAKRRPDVVYVIVFGSVGLRVETVNGRIQSVLTKGDAVGNPLVEEALPPGSQFVALEPVELLAFSLDQFNELLAGVDAAELRARIVFFKSSLLVPILQPWTDAQFEDLARSCWALRLQSKELVVKEGSPADSMYFLQNGKLKVVREVDFSHASSSGFNATQSIRTGTGEVLSPRSAPLHNSGGSSAATVKLLELATLQEGEFFGELALIRYRVDDNRPVDIMSVLGPSGGGAKSLSSTNGGTAALASSATLTNRRSLNTTSTTHHNGRGSIELPPSHLGSTGMYGDTDANMDDDAKELHESQPALTRQATVYAHTPAAVLVLPRKCFIRLFRGAALVRIREYAKGYPSQQDIRSHFQRQQKWDSFKAELVAQVRGTAQQRHGAVPASGAVVPSQIKRGGASGSKSPRR